MPNDPSKPSPPSSRDFLKWGKSFLKDALAKPSSDQRHTRPFVAPTPRNKHTTFLSSDPLALVAMPKATAAELAVRGIVFLDNAQRPLFEPLASHAPAFSPEIEQAVMERCIAALGEVRDRLSAVQDLKPKGRYQGLPLSQVLDGIASKDVGAFFYFARQNAAHYTGKSLRFTEAFVEWLVAHGDPEARAH
ncbi:hypothetical protein J7643_04645 [bacterium]|nr:hypothetical protein [bacterium]